MCQQKHHSITLDQKCLIYKCSGEKLPEIRQLIHCNTHIKLNYVKCFNKKNLHIDGFPRTHSDRSLRGRWAALSDIHILYEFGTLGNDIANNIK